MATQQERLQAIADKAAQLGASAEQIQSAAQQTGVNVNVPGVTPVPTVPKNTQTNVKTPSGPTQQATTPTPLKTQTGTVQPAVSQPVQQQGGITQDMVDRMLAGGATMEQVQAAAQKMGQTLPGQAPAAPTPRATLPTQQLDAFPVEFQEPSYTDVSERRLNEIRNNLNQFAQTSSWMFSDRDTFNREFRYNQRAPEQKEILDDFWNARTSQQQQQQAMDMWSSFTDGQIVNGFISGVISQSDLAELGRINPERFQQINSQIEKTKSFESANNAIKGAYEELTNLLSAEPPANPNLLEIYNQFLGTPEIKEKEEKLNEVKLQIEKIDEDIFNMKSEVEAQYAGTGLTRGVLNAIIADRVEALNKQKRTYGIEYNAMLNSYNSLVKDGEMRYNTTLQQITLDQQMAQQRIANLSALWGLGAEDRQFQKQISLMEYQMQLQASQPGKMGDQFKFVQETDAFGTTSTIVYDLSRTDPSTGGPLRLGTQQSLQNGILPSNSIPTEVGANNFLDIPRNVNGFKNNVGVDINNPGNFTSFVDGAIGMYKSPNGRSYAVFANIQDGYNAMLNDLRKKQAGNTRTGLNANSTVAELLGVWVNGKGSISSGGYFNSFKNATGLSANTRIGDIDPQLLARGIMAGEGTLPMFERGGIDLSRFAPQGNNSWNPQEVMDGWVPPLPNPATTNNMGNMNRGSLEAIRNQFIMNPYSVFTPDQIGAFERFKKSGKPGDLGKNALEYQNNLVNYRVWSEINRTSPQQLGDIYIALSSLPVQLKNSEAELNLAMDMIKTYLAMGGDPYQAGDVFGGFDLNRIPASQRPMAIALRQATLNIPEFNASGIGRSFSNGDVVGAMQQAENAIYNYAGYNPTGLQALASQRPVIEELTQKATGGLGIKITSILSNQKANNLVTQFNLAAQTMGYNERVDAGMRVGQIVGALEGLQSFEAAKINNIRTQFGLPPIPSNNSRILLNPVARLNWMRSMLPKGTTVFFPDPASMIFN